MQDDFGDQEAEDSKGRAKDQMVEMKNEDCCEKFREEIRRALGGREGLPDDWTRSETPLRDLEGVFRRLRPLYPLQSTAAKDHVYVGLCIS